MLQIYIRVVSMPILVEYLSIWDISLRWAGYDPRKYYFRIPLEAENYARILIDAIHNADLACESITLEKRTFEKDEVKESFYYWTDDLFSTTSGQRISRKLLKWAIIDRLNFKQWCERMNAPLPEFWYPKGWNLHYELPENAYPPGLMHDLKFWPKEDREAYFGNLEKTESGKATITDLKTRPNQEARIVCQHIARAIWRKEPDRTIASVANDPIIQEYGGAKSYEEATVRVWVQAVAPKEVSARRGRPPKNGV